MVKSREGDEAVVDDARDEEWFLLDGRGPFGLVARVDE